MKSTKKTDKKKTGKSATLAKSAPRTPVSKKTTRKPKGGKGKGIQNEPRGTAEPNQDIDTKREEAKQNPIKRRPQDEQETGLNEGEEEFRKDNDLNTTEDEIGKRKLWL